MSPHASVDKNVLTVLFIMEIWYPSQYEDGLFGYGYSHCKYKTVVRPSYLYNGNLYIFTNFIVPWLSCQDIIALMGFHQQTDVNE